MTFDEQRELAKQAMSVYEGKAGACAVLVSHNGTDMSVDWATPDKTILAQKARIARLLAYAGKMLLDEVEEATKPIPRRMVN